DLQHSPDFTPGGLKIEGPYENDRNAASRELFKAILQEVYGADQCIIAHHLVYEAIEKRDGFDFRVIEEIPSADTLIFDHDVAKTLWGAHWKASLTQLALEPVETRDALLAHLYYGRPKQHGR